MLFRNGMTMIRVGEYVERYGSDFLYIMYNGHIAEYDSIQNKSVRENIRNEIFYLETDVFKRKIHFFGNQEITLIMLNWGSKGYRRLTWNKEKYSPDENLNRYRYFDRVRPDGTKTEWIKDN